jgi:hypothetical protein
MLALGGRGDSSGQSQKARAVIESTKFMGNVASSIRPNWPWSWKMLGSFVLLATGIAVCKGFSGINKAVSTPKAPGRSSSKRVEHPWAFGLVLRYRGGGLSAVKVRSVR